MGGTRRYGDDGARSLRNHRTHCCAHAVHDALEVDVDGLAPCLWVNMAKRADRVDDASVVNDDVDLAESLDRGVHGLLCLPVAGHVAGDRQRLFADLPRKFGNLLAGSRNQGDIGPSGSKSLRGGGPDAAACACDQNGFTGHVKVFHRTPFRSPAGHFSVAPEFPTWTGTARAPRQSSVPQGLVP